MTEPNAGGPPNNEPAPAAGETPPKDAGLAGGEKPPEGTPAPDEGLAGGKEPGAEPPAGGEKPPEGTKAPEKYEPFTVAEGQTIDADKLGSFEPIARKLNLSQDQAQELVTWQSENMAAEAKSQIDAMKEQTETWLKASKEDPEIGGAKWEATLVLARAAYVELVPQDAKVILEQVGLHTHPAFIKMFRDLGNVIGEDKLILDPNAPGGKKKKTLYDHPTSQKFT